MEKMILLTVLIGAIITMAEFPDGLTARPPVKAKVRRRRRSLA